MENLVHLEDIQQVYSLSIDEKEPDDYLHNPDPVQDAEYDKIGFI